MFISCELLKPKFSWKNILNKFYRGYNFKDRLKHDPIEFPHRYSNTEDIEVAGFIASCFAYGKIELFKPIIEKILRPAGKHPADFFMDFTLKKVGIDSFRDEKYFNTISYRFSKEKDVLCLVYMLSKVLKRWGSLKNLFYYYYRPEHKDIGHALGSFVNSFLDTDTSPVYGRNIRPHGLTHFFPSPKKGSACKRMNLFLRWMVRTRDIDFGVWDKIPPSKLIIPLDTHIAKISRCLGLTKRVTSGWKTAREITESLKKLDPHDPLKYDFALCHHGISGMCKGRKYKNICLTCDIYTF